MCARVVICGASNAECTKVCVCVYVCGGGGRTKRAKVRALQHAKPRITGATPQ